MELFLYTLTILIAMTLSGIIGFAGNIIALPLLSLFLDLKTAVAILLLITFIQALLQMIQMWDGIIWKDVGMISFYMLILVPFGFVALQYLSEYLMKGLLGLFILVTAIRSIQQANHEKRQYTERPWHKLYLVLSGLLTGAFACGGPLMVIYCKNRYPERDRFRAMQFAVGAVVMGLSCAGNLWAGVYTMAAIPYVFWGLLAVAAAIYLSTRLVRKMNAVFFQRLVNFALLVSAILLMVQAIKGFIG